MLLKIYRFLLDVENVYENLATKESTFFGVLHNDINNYLQHHYLSGLSAVRWPMSIYKIIANVEHVVTNALLAACIVSSSMLLTAIYTDQMVSPFIVNILQPLTYGGILISNTLVAISIGIPPSICFSVLGCIRDQIANQI